MISSYLILCSFSISACFPTSVVARKAILGGEIVLGRLFSYQVSVQVRGHGHVCGGAILNDYFALSAAHCVLNRDRRMRSASICVVAGTKSLNKTSPPSAISRVEKVYFPKEFHPTTDFSHGDLAVLKLVSSLHSGYNHAQLEKLLLPRTYEHNGIATVSGYGWNKYRIVHNRPEGGTDGHLRYLWTDILTDVKCEEYYPPGAIQSYLHLCANAQPLPFPHYSKWLGVCKGDDGNPLVNGRGIIIGILSRFESHCNKRLPGVYTRVAHYSGMIDNVIQYGRDPHMVSLRA